MSCENKGCSSKDFTLRRIFAERFHIKMMKSYIILQFRENGSIAHCAQCGILRLFLQSLHFYINETYQKPKFRASEKARMPLFKLLKSLKMISRKI